MVTHETISYDIIRDEISIGDLLLFSGDNFVSRVIRFSQLMSGYPRNEAKFSHVALVIREPLFNQVLVWESTLNKKVNQNVVSGVQVSALSEQLQKYAGEIWLRKLRVAPLEHQVDQLANFRHEIKGRPYEGDKAELLMSLADEAILGQDLSSVFCSELVAEGYKRMGYLPQNMPSNSYTPADFAGMKPHFLENKIVQILVD